MKLYMTTYFLTPIETDQSLRKYAEFSSSQDGASKVRTRLKALAKNDLDCDFTDIESREVDVPTTRTDLIKFLNGQMAHPSWVATPAAEKLGV